MANAQIAKKDTILTKIIIVKNSLIIVMMLIKTDNAFNVKMDMIQMTKEYVKRKRMIIVIITVMLIRMGMSLRKIVMVAN